ncbi:MAG: hypothetical protein IKN54_07315 [Lachnospiraceae bacterium]|nr:hypothetical protein [Lachnospiraceae bacterium]
MNYSDAQIGDIVARVDNSNDRYVITGFGECNGRRTWRGFNEKGLDQGGTIAGNWEFETYVLAGRAELDIFDKITKPKGNRTIKVNLNGKEIEIYNCPNDMSRNLVARQSKGKWYYWADFQSDPDVERAIRDLESNKCTARFFRLDERYAKPDLSSHSEKEILNGCIALMQELNDRFVEYLDFMDVKPECDDEKWGTSFSYFEIVQRLFLHKTLHSGGTSTRLKIAELGFCDPKDVKFIDTRETEDEDG